jgi:hypothetical protein
LIRLQKNDLIKSDTLPKQLCRMCRRDDLAALSPLYSRKHLWEIANHLWVKR